MAAELIEGTVAARAMGKEILEEVTKLKKQTGKLPGLSVVLVGENPVSEIYVNKKVKTAKEFGLYLIDHRLPAEVTEDDLLDIIHELNNNPEIHGIFLQLPLPYHIDDQKILDAITPEKDVDGFHPVNFGRMVKGEDSFIPCTPHGCLKMLEYINYDLKGKHAVVVGRSNVVGKPMAILFLQKNATVTVCHSHTANLPEICRQADVLVVAVGRPELVKKDWVKPGAVVIDVGINRVGDKLVGDIAFDEVSDVAGYITPVPGSVDPITVNMLVLNTVISFKRHNNLF